MRHDAVPGSPGHEDKERCSSKQYSVIRRRRGSSKVGVTARGEWSFASGDNPAVTKSSDGRDSVGTSNEADGRGVELMGAGDRFAKGSSSRR